VIVEDFKQDFEVQTLNHLAMLYNYALALTREEDQAEDLVQETFLRAHCNYNRFKSGTNFKAWLFTILRNLFFNQYRQMVKECSLEVLIEEESIQNQDEMQEMDRLFFPSAEALMIMKVDIEEAFYDLPEKLKEVIVLKHWGGLNYSEISKMLGCPLGTVMSRQWTARNRLRRILRDYKPP
jgi:RNA polymerase sigma-70 factor (ECF subfamily)